MRRWITLCACILALLAMPFAVTAAVIGDENETPTPMGETGQMDNQTANMSIAAYISQDENLTRLAEAVNTAGLYDTLNGEGPYTIFAPSNEAFNALGNDTVSQLMAEPDNLTMVLQYHVVDGEYTAENITEMAGNQTGEQNETAGNESEGGVLDIFSGLLGGEEEEENMSTLTTLAGEDLNVSATDGEVMVENATVTMTDIYATNGVIHIIDQVLVPPGVNVTAAGNETVTPVGGATPIGEATPVGEATPMGEATPVGEATPAMTANQSGLVGVVQ
ncbi:fasciclin domain-containing protein [Methanoculleus horonobensis]|uniref:fasciclin domain-containing protein n=1 Tax=Methanoculleus horonobensis TaxID=528314 RepID=UPI000834B7DB|nr:fasciclin domain-containing protein [Methanoculleus horonobensis]